MIPSLHSLTGKSPAIPYPLSQSTHIWFSSMKCCPSKSTQTRVSLAWEPLSAGPNSGICSCFDALIQTEMKNPMSSAWPVPITTRGAQGNRKDFISPFVSSFLQFVSGKIFHPFFSFLLQENHQANLCLIEKVFYIICRKYRKRRDMCLLKILDALQKVYHKRRGKFIFASLNFHLG